MDTDIHSFSHENLLRRLETAEYRNGSYVLNFYSENRRPVPYRAGTVEEFSLSPSGGRLRDKNFDLLFYDSRYDTYRGFQPPQHMK
jgi:hypothetical protein